MLWAMKFCENKKPAIELDFSIHFFSAAKGNTNGSQLKSLS